ncbi:DgyrCDS4117 [Dimorphilus gyrociliatus]|uniref:DgyrCDS4117 n=1 Tax=Dimorphilus gyrociliatus TaxID=2664684 RepID=A0A7I8VG00_9ANNE|nr:DgyrCDS4117 [Dimorphilus gyrociliatus]
MSSDESSIKELRTHLYKNMKDKGYLSNLKCQLRNKLLADLKTKGLQAEKLKSKGTEQEQSLSIKAANSIIIDHLEKCKMEYTLSMFLPESNTENNMVFNTSELLQILRISPESDLYKYLMEDSSVKSEEGFLSKLLKRISEEHGLNKIASACQTDTYIQPHHSSLENKMQMIDNSFTDASREHRSVEFENRITAYKKEIDKRSRADFEAEIIRFKETEISRIRIEEREKLREQLDATRRELERTYHVKAEALLQRERHAVERVQQQQSIQEREVYSQRQSLLDEIEAVRKKEAQVRRDAELMRREQMIQEERMKTREELTSKREENARKKEIELAKELHDQMSKFKLEQEANYMQRSKDLEFRELKVRDDQRRLDDELRDIYNVKQELREKASRVCQLEAELNSSRQQLIVFEKKSELQADKIREMVDYETLKKENFLLKKDLEVIKDQYAQASKEAMVERKKQESLYREMTERAERPSPEVILIQRELDKAREQSKQQEILGNHHRNLSEKNLQDERESKRQLLQKYEEQSMQMKEMNRELMDLRQQLGMTTKALTNEIYRKPFAEVSNDSKHDISIDRYTSGRILREEEVPTRSRDLHSPESHNSSSSTDLVAETKRRLKSLDAEAEVSTLNI